MTLVPGAFPISCQSIFNKTGHVVVNSKVLHAAVCFPIVLVNVSFAGKKVSSECDPAISFNSSGSSKELSGQAM